MLTPTNRQVLASTPLAGLRPVFGTGFGETVRRFQMLKTLLTPHDCYGLFAEPLADEEQIQWQTELPGDVVPYTTLLPERQERTKAILRYYVDAAYELIKNYQENDELSRMLDACLEIPDYATIFLVGKRPVLVGWGFLRRDFNPPRGLIRKLTQRLPPPRLMVNVKLVDSIRQVPLPNARVTLQYENQTRSLQTNAEGNVSFQDIFPFDFPRFQIEASADAYRWATKTLTIDRFMADLIDTGFVPLIAVLPMQPSIREKALQFTIIDKKTRRPLSGADVRVTTSTTEQSQTSVANGLVTFPAVPFGEKESFVVYVTQAGYADERIELPVETATYTFELDSSGLQGKRGAFNINLRWETIDDLDLIVTDPAQNIIYYQNREADCFGCKGVLDIDANATDDNLTDQPQENIYWEQVYPGAYRIDVLCYKRRTSPEVDIPFTVLTIHGNDRFTLTGTIRQEGERTLVNIVEI